MRSMDTLTNIIIALIMRCPRYDQIHCVHKPFFLIDYEVVQWMIFSTTEQGSQSDTRTSM